MADWPILGWLVHLVADTLRHGLRADRRGARYRTSAGDTGRCGISRPHPAILPPEWAARECESIAFEARIAKLAWLQKMSSRFLSSAVAERSAGDHTASLSTGYPDQSQARDFRVTFGPPSRLHPRRMTSRGETSLRPRRSNRHLRRASTTSLAGPRPLLKRYRLSQDMPPSCLRVGRNSLFLGRGTFPLASARGCGGIPSRPPGLVLHTRSFLLPCQPRYAVRVVTFLERRIPPAKRHPTWPHRLLAQNFPYLGTYFASSKCDPPACFAWQVLFFSFKPDV